MMLAIILVGVAMAERLIWDLGPNIELVTMASVVAGMYLKGRVKWLVPLAIMAVSDLVLGYGLISLFTWSGFLVMVGLPGLIAKLKLSKVMTATVAGLGGNGIFYLWTNGGVWLTDQWGMYSRDVAGLVSCYVNGLPFYKAQMVGTLVFIPLAVALIEEVKARRKNESIWLAQVRKLIS